MRKREGLQEEGGGVSRAKRLERVGSPVSLEAPRAARGVKRRVISRGPSRGRSGFSQRLCRTEGGGDRGSGWGQGLRRSGNDKSRGVGRSQGLLGSGGDKSREVGRSRELLGSGGDKRRGVGRSRGMLGSGGDKSREVGRSRGLLGSGGDKGLSIIHRDRGGVSGWGHRTRWRWGHCYRRGVVNHVRRLEAGWCGRVFGGTKSHRGRGAPYYRRVLGGQSRQGLGCRGIVRRSVRGRWRVA